MRKSLIIVITVVIRIFASLMPMALALRASSFSLIGEMKALAFMSQHGTLPKAHRQWAKLLGAQTTF
jgi:hypothetical protein